MVLRVYKFLGKFWVLGIAIRECRDIKNCEISEGNGHRNEKHSPSLGKCSVG